jgi:hypothetical protein
VSRRIVNGPDGREWVVTRFREGEGPLAKLSRRARYVVEARTEGPPEDVRHWFAPKMADANRLVEEVAMALRTGSEGPLQPED